MTSTLIYFKLDTKDAAGPSTRKLSDKPMVPLTDRPSEGRLEMAFEDQVVFAAYRRRPGCLVIDYVEAPPALRGTGAAGVFMAALAAKAQADGDQILPLCGYAAAWLRRHTEHHDLIATA
jgi:predicted GNAT family acetyltransferase